MPKLKNYIKSGEASCNADAAIFFVQSSCKLSSSDISTRKLYGLCVASLAVFMALFFNIFVDYIKSIEKNLNVEWDVKTITAGDYSVEVDIPAAMFDKFKSDHFDSNNDDNSCATQFRDWFKKELETRLTALPNLGFEEEGT